MTMTISEYRKSYQNGPYAWPGGYPVYLLLSDGATLCRKCERKERRHILEGAADPKYRTGWEPEAHYILWEGSEECAHCYAKLDSAYGDTEDQS